MTDRELKKWNQEAEDRLVKALECCAKDECAGCPYDNACDPRNPYPLVDALDLIKHLKAENEKYKETVGELGIKDGEVVCLLNGKETKYINKEVAETLKRMALKTAKAEAYKECIAEVKAELKNIAKIDFQGGYYYLVGEAFFNNILMKMEGENK